RRRLPLPLTACGRCPVPAFAADRRWAKSTARASQPGTQQRCALTQRRCRGQTFCKAAGRSDCATGDGVEGIATNDLIMRIPKVASGIVIGARSYIIEILV